MVLHLNYTYHSALENQQLTHTQHIHKYIYVEKLSRRERNLSFFKKKEKKIRNVNCIHINCANLFVLILIMTNKEQTKFTKRVTHLWLTYIVVCLLFITLKGIFIYYIGRISLDKEIILNSITSKVQSELLPHSPNDITFTNAQATHFPLRILPILQNEYYRKCDCYHE